jgi:glutaredoxin
LDQDLKDKLVKVDIDIDDKFTEYRESMEEVTGCKTVPKVFENGVFIGDSGATIAHFEYCTLNKRLSHSWD